MMKRLLTILLFLLSTYSYGQGSDTLEFELTIKVFHFETNEELPCFTVVIIGTDGSSREFTGKEGAEVPPIPLKPNTSYSTIIKIPGFMIAKGKETTVGLTESKKFWHEYKLQSYRDYVIKLPQLSYNQNEFALEDHMHDSLVFMYNVMIENPTLVIAVIGFQTPSEKEGISQLRAHYVKKEMIAIGVHEDRLVIDDRKTQMLEETDYNRNPCKPDRITSRECRCVAFKVVADNFVPKED